MNRLKIIFCICCLLLASACKKNAHNSSFDADSRAFFQSYRDADSIVHSFANYPAAESKELILPLKIMGDIANYDRTVYIEVDRAHTTADAQEYNLDETVVVPAGSIEGKMKVIVKDTPRLQSEKVELKLKLKPSADFIIEPVKEGNMEELVEFRVIWTNILSKPNDWPTTLWGGYSKAKHRLVIELTGLSEYSGEEWTSSGRVYSVMGVCNQWLADFKDDHQGNPYLDENGKEIRFCPTCN